MQNIIFIVVYKFLLSNFRKKRFIITLSLSIRKEEVINKSKIKIMKNFNKKKSWRDNSKSKAFISYSVCQILNSLSVF